MALAKAEHISLESPQDAIKYVQTYLDYTRYHYNISYLVTSPENLIFAFDSYEPEDPQRQEQAHIKERLGSVITPPAAERTEKGYLVKPLLSINNN